MIKLTTYLGHGNPEHLPVHRGYAGTAALASARRRSIAIALEQPTECQPEQDRRPSRRLPSIVALCKREDRQTSDKAGGRGSERQTGLPTSSALSTKQEQRSQPEHKTRGHPVVLPLRSDEASRDACCSARNIGKCPERYVRRTIGNRRTIRCEGRGARTDHPVAAGNRQGVGGSAEGEERYKYRSTLPEHQGDIAQ